MIEVSTALTIPEPKRIELFARKRVPGWMAWGDQVDDTPGVDGGGD